MEPWIALGALCLTVLVVVSGGFYWLGSRIGSVETTVVSMAKAFDEFRGNGSKRPECVEAKGRIDHLEQRLKDLEE